jgi:succinyl-CoA---D-citramalate CoA-transferase
MSNGNSTHEVSPPLKGLRVLELGTLIAGPYCTRLLAEFGAEVIKIEAPGEGDPLRRWRKLHHDTSLWWFVQARNKKSVTVNLKQAQGQEIVKRIARGCDIVVENFRPGALEKWGLGYEQLAQDNPGLIMVRLSGYGQTGPYRDQPGFGAIGEAMGGIRFVTGFPDRPPARAGISLGDSVAAMYGVIGALMALHARAANGGRGQVIDVALYEAVFSLMESLLPEYDRFAFVRSRTGASLPGIVPSNTYSTRDGKYIVIGANADSIFKRLMTAIGREDLAADPDLARNEGRVTRTEELDQVIGQWCARHDLDQVLELLARAEVPSGKIYDAADIARDVHYAARGMLEQHRLPDGTPIKLPGIVPKLSDTPGGTRWIGPELGAHTEEVLRGLGYTAGDIEALRAAGAV